MQKKVPKNYTSLLVASEIKGWGFKRRICTSTVQFNLNYKDELQFISLLSPEYIKIESYYNYIYKIWDRRRAKLLQF